jgi:hypothetical protein
VIGKIFITRHGYDPEFGKHVKDPCLGETPSIGACRPDVRKQLSKGDHIFVISGKIEQAPQVVLGGFQIESKIHALEAFERFPEQRLHKRPDGQLDGNVIVNGRGKQHRLDNHSNFDARLNNYVIGTNCVALVRPAELALGRLETLDVLREIFKKNGSRPIDIVGRWGSRVTETQALQLRDWLSSVKSRA